MINKNLVIKPSKLQSCAQWVTAGLYTTYYGSKELSCCIAWKLLRTTNDYNIKHNKQLITNYKQYEQRIIQKAEFYRHQWGHKFLDTFNIHYSVVHEAHSSTINSNKSYIYAQLNQSSILELALTAVAISDRSKCIYCNNNHTHGKLPAEPLYIPYYLVNIEFSLIPFFGWNRGLTGIIIKRGDRNSTQKGIDRLLQRIIQFKDLFYISIEGQRSRVHNQLSPYKNGISYISITTQTDIIPVIFYNTGKLWSYGDWQINSGYCSIHILDTVDVKQYTIDDRYKLTETLRNIAENRLKQFDK